MNQSNSAELRANSTENFQFGGTFWYQTKWMYGGVRSRGKEMCGERHHTDTLSRTRTTFPAQGGRH